MTVCASTDPSQDSTVTSRTVHLDIERCILCEYTLEWQETGVKLLERQLSSFGLSTSIS